MSDVQVEREKTKRTLIVATSTTLVAIIAMVMFFRNIDNRGGSLKVSDKGLEVTLEEPTLQQLGAESRTVSAFGDSVSLTTGSIADTALRTIRKVPRQGSFSGGNFIDTTAGFIMPSDRPSSWTVKDSSNVRVFAGTDGSSINIKQSRSTGRLDALRETRSLIDSLERIGIRATSQSDSTHGTALVWYREPQTSRIVCVKIMQADSRLYSVRAVAPSDSAAKSIIRSVSAFTPIQQKVAVTAPGIRRLQR